MFIAAQPRYLAPAERDVSVEHNIWLRWSRNYREREAINIWSLRDPSNILSNTLFTPLLENCIHRLQRELNQVSCLIRG
jgi:hypothetical protein